MGENIRTIQLHFYVTEKENKIIKKQMEETGIVNLSHYLRKMAISGYIIHLDMTEIKNVSRLLRSCSNNLRQHRIIQVCGLRSKIFRQNGQIIRVHTVVWMRIFGQSDGIRFKQGVRRELCGGALNQYVRLAHETGSIYETDIKDLNERLTEVTIQFKKILKGFVKVVSIADDGV